MTEERKLIIEFEPGLYYVSMKDGTRKKEKATVFTKLKSATATRNKILKFGVYPNTRIIDLGEKGET